MVLYVAFLFYNDYDSGLFTRISTIAHISSTRNFNYVPLQPILWTGRVIRFSQFLWRDPWRTCVRKQYQITTKHNNARTMYIFIAIYQIFDFVVIHFCICELYIAGCQRLYKWLDWRFYAPWGHKSIIHCVLHCFKSNYGTIPAAMLMLPFGTFSPIKCTHTVLLCLFCCGYIINLCRSMWYIYQYPSGLLQWYWGPTDKKSVLVRLIGWHRTYKP